MQAERLTGRQRGEILRLHFSEIFAEEHREQANWLVQQTGGSSNIRLEDMAVRRADGMVVPISLSCNWVNVDGTSVAQVIMRDVTQLRQMQRELQSYAEQLEERVTRARTNCRSAKSAIARCSCKSNNARSTWR
jgi:PAS domain S-box-containing protein